jgi:hypothetical protein
MSEGVPPPPLCLDLTNRFYQPNATLARECVPCPSGFTTAIVGATLKRDCFCSWPHHPFDGIRRLRSRHVPRRFAPMRPVPHRDLQRRHWRHRVHPLPRRHDHRAHGRDGGGSLRRLLQPRHVLRHRFDGPALLIAQGPSLVMCAQKALSRPQTAPLRASPAAGGGRRLGAGPPPAQAAPVRPLGGLMAHPAHRPVPVGDFCPRRRERLRRVPPRSVFKFDRGALNNFF